MEDLSVLDESKLKDINFELEEAGVYGHSVRPFTRNYLLHMLYNNEHIMAAVLGRRKESEGFFGFVEGLLIATDQRIIFLDHRPGYTTMDEVSYNVVSGINISSTLFYASITLFTAVTNYKLSFINHSSAQKFAEYVETRTLNQVAQVTHNDNHRPAYAVTIDNSARTFLEEHSTGVLTTVERTGSLRGSVVYYTLRGNDLYFITKEHSRKAENIIADQHVAFVVFDEAKIQTIQLQGIVEQLFNEDVKIDVLAELMKPRVYQDGSNTPPILRTGVANIVAYKITPTNFSFTDYSHLR